MYLEEHTSLKDLPFNYEVNVEDYVYLVNDSDNEEEIVISRFIKALEKQYLNNKYSVSLDELSLEEIAVLRNKIVADSVVALEVNGTFPLVLNKHTMHLHIQNPDKTMTVGEFTKKYIHELFEPFVAELTD